MSIARAVTKRIKRPEVPKDQPVSPLPTRSHTVKSPTNFDRSKISLPVALVSTTNMLSYNAPNIKGLKKDIPLPISLTQSSEEDSDHSTSGRSRASSQSSRGTLTDASSVAESPTSPTPNHLSGFFPPGKQIRKSASTTSLKKVKEEVVEPVPALPQRAVEHSKDAHEELARKRSVRSMSTHIRSTSRGSISIKSKEQRSSIDIIKGLNGKDVHPFDRELKQLNEVAEEFIGVARSAEAEADLAIMRSMNLATFCAVDYFIEIRPLFSDRFGLKKPMAWI